MYAETGFSVKPEIRNKPIILALKFPVDYPDNHIENQLIQRGCSCVAGVDEAGRGPLAGPVVASAVIVPQGLIYDSINDSKRLNHYRREQLDTEIRKTAIVSVSVVSVEEIERLNILHATMLAMKLAVNGLSVKPDHILIDGNRLPDGLEAPATAIVKGDARCISIAAASIIAKVKRDRIMAELDKDYPDYRWSRNAGYATREHLLALNKYGPTPHHRMGYAPVRKAVEDKIQYARNRKSCLL